MSEDAKAQTQPFQVAMSQDLTLTLPEENMEQFADTAILAEAGSSSAGGNSNDSAAMPAQQSKGQARDGASTASDEAQPPVTSEGQHDTFALQKQSHGSELSATAHPIQYQNQPGIKPASAPEMHVLQPVADPIHSPVSLTQHAPSWDIIEPVPMPLDAKTPTTHAVNIGPMWNPSSLVTAFMYYWLPDDSYYADTAHTETLSPEFSDMNPVSEVVELAHDYLPSPSAFNAYNPSIMVSDLFSKGINYFELNEVTQGQIDKAHQQIEKDQQLLEQIENDITYYHNQIETLSESLNTNLEMAIQEYTNFHAQQLALDSILQQFSPFSLWQQLTSVWNNQEGMDINALLGSINPESDESSLASVTHFMSQQEAAIAGAIENAEFQATQIASDVMGHDVSSFSETQSLFYQAQSNLPLLEAHKAEAMMEFENQQALYQQQGFFNIFTSNDYQQAEAALWQAEQEYHLAQQLVAKLSGPVKQTEALHQLHDLSVLALEACQSVFDSLHSLHQAENNITDLEAKQADVTATKAVHENQYHALVDEYQHENTNEIPSDEPQDNTNTAEIPVGLHFVETCPPPESVQVSCPPPEGQSTQALQASDIFSPASNDLFMASEKTINPTHVNYCHQLSQTTQAMHHAELQVATNMAQLNQANHDFAEANAALNLALKAANDLGWSPVTPEAGLLSSLNPMYLTEYYVTYSYNTVKSPTDAKQNKLMAEKAFEYDQKAINNALGYDDSPSLAVLQDRLAKQMDLTQDAKTHKTYQGYEKTLDMQKQTLDTWDDVINQYDKQSKAYDALKQSEQNLADSQQNYQAIEQNHDYLVSHPPAGLDHCDIGSPAKHMDASYPAMEMSSLMGDDMLHATMPIDTPFI